MSLSTEALFGVSQSSRLKRDTICGMPDLTSDRLDDDFDLNKSYPCTQRPLYKKTLQRRYYPGYLRARDLQISSLHPDSHISAVSLPHPSTTSETEESLFSQLVSGDFDLSGCPAALNPNKVLLTVDHKTREILSANEQACKLFECSTTELIGKKLSCILKKTSQVLEEALEEDVPLLDGTVAAVSGKVGNVLTCDLAFAHLHGYHHPDELKGMSVKELIPSLQIPLHSNTLPKMLRVQRVWGKSRGSASVPLLVKLQGAVLCGKPQHQNNGTGCTCPTKSFGRTDAQDSQPCSPLPSPVCKSEGSNPGLPSSEVKVDSIVLSPCPALEYSGTVWVYAPLSGLLLLHPDGSIYSIHNHLALTLFGYDKDELLTKSVTFLMPGFYGWMTNSDREASPFPDSQAEGNKSTASSKISGKNDPSSLVAGDMATVHQAVLGRTSTGRGKMFTGTGTRLEKQGSNLSTLSLPAVTSTRVVMADDTTELMEEAAQVAFCTSQLDIADTTQAFLKTFAWVEPPEGETYCLVSTEQQLEDIPSHNGHAIGRVGGTAPDVGKDHRSCAPVLQDSSFEVISIESRSSSGFCEKFAVHGGSDPGQAMDSRSAHIVDSLSCFLDLNSNGELVTHALAELDLSDSIELLSGGGYNNDNQNSLTSCDTAELLRTPSPCVVESDQEAEPVETDVNARNNSKEEQVEDNHREQHQWPSLSSIHKEKSQEVCTPMNGGSQPTPDIPATSTPKKQKVNGNTLSSDTTQILEGRYEGSAYHRDGTRVDVQCDVCRTNLPDGRSMFCVWMSMRGQQGALLQTDRSQHDQSGVSLGERICEALHSTMDLEKSRACDGQFEEEYQPLNPVGKGAFGFVWEAMRRSDGLEVIVKFIRKARIVSECWVDDPMLGRVSQEIAILTRVQHHNIVKVLEVFENGYYFQMVMEKHGDCLDLFDFIDMQPRLDEPLASYIFRQGPELEMWSLGVLLYTLLFSENPFCGVGEILHAKLKPPFPLSPDLHDVLCGLLHPDPAQRLTLDQLLLQSWISQPISLAEYSWTEVVPATNTYRSPQHESSPKAFVRQGLFPDEHDETLPDDEEDDDDRLSMVALETELQKYLHED
ncbi:hypothetical protein FQN60_016526 [Etheostoma spectabile]|uniref:non-specific serine/threonine protein kinase n=1 Tax=Etheostoma spectabile TaxID=54343 RepID=A0A5J5D2S2_9PERO|nr:hypothetical protein FQN60_016526 [Etheostoma spectabile]